MRHFRLPKLFLAALLTAALCVTGAWAFTDTETHWAKDSISRWSDRYEIINGYGDGTFRPDNSITRGAFAGILNRLMHYNARSSRSAFSDLRGNYWEDEILRLHAAGVYMGNNGQALAQDSITRQQCVTMIARAFDISAENVNLTYWDSDNISPYARAAISEMTERGYLEGAVTEIFRPTEPITRAEVVRIFDNIVKALIQWGGTISYNVNGNVLINGERGGTLENMVVAGDVILAPGAAGTINLINVAIEGEVVNFSGHSPLINRVGDGPVVVEAEDPEDNGIPYPPVIVTPEDPNLPPVITENPQPVIQPEDPNLPPVVPNHPQPVVQPDPEPVTPEPEPVTPEPEPVIPITPVESDNPWSPPGEDIPVVETPAVQTPVVQPDPDDPWAPPVEMNDQPVVIVEPEDEQPSSNPAEEPVIAWTPNSTITLPASGHPHTWEYPTNRKIQPSDVYTPSATTGQTFTYSGRTIPIYSRLQLNQVGTPGLFYWANGRLWYGGSRYNVTFGVDVSAHNNRNRSNSTINWTAAKNDGVQWAMIRTAVRMYGSGGQLSSDQYYARNIDGALAAGIFTGAYVFSTATTVEEALEEADLMIRLLRGHPIDGPVCYDWEINSTSYRNAGLSKEMATACAVAFCERVTEAGYAPMVYISQLAGYTKFDMGALRTYLKWYPQYPSRSTPAPYPTFRYQVDVWQYSDSTRVDGIGSTVDANLWFWPK